MSTYNNTRFSLMTFPQKVDASGKLTLNILFIPRNISPIDEVSTSSYSASGKAKAFIEAKPKFQIVVANNPDPFPGYDPALSDELTYDFAPYEPPSSFNSEIGNIYHILLNKKDGNGNPKYFDIDPARSADALSTHRASAPQAKENTIKKYLPQTYRSAFNFTSPRTPNAVIDDSYRCAIRDQKPPLPFKKDTKVSWGKVYAYLLKQPLLAKKAGLIYETTIQLNPGAFSKGGWIYVTLMPSSTYAPELNKSLEGPPDPDGPFIKRYAARIPILKAGSNGNPFEERDLFTAVLFPVLNFKEGPFGNFAEAFIEAAKYCDGFATIVHANQPVSQNILQEEQDGLHPQKEIGIRLGWEDEQILIWYIRQMSVGEDLTNERLDAPLGVNGYHIDVWHEKDQAVPGDKSKWESLTAVTRKDAPAFEGISLAELPIGKPFEAELPYQVFPSKAYGSTDNYWLPMYFASWNNASLVLPDTQASAWYGIDQDNECIDHEKNQLITRKVSVSGTFSPQPIITQLQYGNPYKFRVRLSDITGGGPDVSSELAEPLPGQTAEVDFFRRFIAPNTLRFGEDVSIIYNSNDVNFKGTNLKVLRPLLGYPAVVYTWKYSNPLEELKQAIADTPQPADPNVKKSITLGLPDPDVTKVEIKVEVETLQMDNLASENGRENFIPLYTTHRYFEEKDFFAPLEIKFKYKDFLTLNLANKQPFPDPADNATIDAKNGDIILPTARNVRLTLRAVGDGNETYWGCINENHDLDSRYGKSIVLKMRENAISENKLFIGEKDTRVLQGIYLQPDPIKVKPNAVIQKKLQGENEGMPDIVQRLAQQLDLECKGLTLISKNGERLVFWCSNFIRHSMAPDNSSITFDNKSELNGQWLVCMDFKLNRDWSWDGLETRSLIINRSRCFDRDKKIKVENGIETIELPPPEYIGDLEVKRIASYQAIQKGEDEKIHREFTRIVLIDIVDPKQVSKGGAVNFPDRLLLQYLLTAKLLPFKNDPVKSQETTLLSEILELPITTNPLQTPKILGAGYALSPYYKNKLYSSTEPRKRYLWLEFEKSPDDPNDELFCRMLAYAPDQLLSNNHPDQLEIPEELPLPIDPEYIRVVIPESGHDNSGLNAMQKLEKSQDNERHFYLLPIPPGLHPESPELFGMFTYEFRYGHSGRTWSTAQGRFGRALRIAGIQHPAPNLLCTVQRDEEMIRVSASYAKAVFKGKNVTSKPPRTSLWCLIYAQVMQADGLEYRNILLNEIELKPPKWEQLQESWEKRTSDIDIEMKEIRKEIDTKVESIPSKTDQNKIHKLILEGKMEEVASGEIKGTKLIYLLLKKLEDLTKEMQDLKNKLESISFSKMLEIEEGYHAYGGWLSQDVKRYLGSMGLPVNSPLSVICVEFFGQITNIFDHINDYDKNYPDMTYQYENARTGHLIRTMKDELMDNISLEFGLDIAIGMEKSHRWIEDTRVKKEIDPLNKELGLHRILRTSPLTEVPPICCKSDCE